MKGSKNRPSCELVYGLWRLAYIALSWARDLLQSLPAWVFPRSCDDPVILGSQRKKILWGFPSHFFFSRPQTAAGFVQAWGMLGDHVCYYQKELPIYCCKPGSSLTISSHRFRLSLTSLENSVLLRIFGNGAATSGKKALRQRTALQLQGVVLCWCEATGLHKHMLV